MGQGEPSLSSQPHSFILICWYQSPTTTTTTPPPPSKRGWGGIEMVMKSWNPKHCSSQTSGLCCILCGTAAHYRLDYLGFKPQWGQDFLHMSSHAPNKQRSQDFINFTVSSTCNRSFIFWFVLILQHSLSCMGPYIVLTIFLSNILSAFASPTVLVQVSDL